MTLYKSNQLRHRGLFPTDWIKHIDKWTIDEIEPIKLLPDRTPVAIEENKTQNSDEKFIIDTAQRYGISDTLIFLTRRKLMLTLRKLLRK